MRRTAAFIVGAPGVGKTTALAALLDPFGTQLVPSPKWTLCSPVAMVGHYTGASHDGGDTVPYNGAQAALDFWRDYLLTDPSLVAFVFDGDRFSTANVLSFVMEHAEKNDVDVCCVYLDASQEALDERRAARGSTQDPAWMKGRGTKAARFAEKLGSKTTTVDTTALDVEQVQGLVRDHVLPS